MFFIVIFVKNLLYFNNDYRIINEEKHNRDYKLFSKIFKPNLKK